MVPKDPVVNDDTEELESSSSTVGAVKEQPPSPEAVISHGGESDPAQISSTHNEALEATAEERIPPTAPGYPKIPAPALDGQSGYGPEKEYQFELERLKLARAYIPWQRYGPTYSPREALERGTLFPELYSPYPY
ncbi:MAG TPA: hypothetical protein DEF36_17050 [Desulfotomaculum sp.]|nr:hypothetical protein [Desulfotomaculum sp.]